MLTIQEPISPAAEPAASAGPRAPRLSKRTKQIVSIGVSVVLIVAIFWYVLPQFADFSKVWPEIGAMTWIELGVLAAAAIWNLVTYWLVTVAATPGLTYPQAMVLTESTTAVANT